MDILKRLEEIVDKQYRVPFLNSITPVDCGVDSFLEVEKDMDENEDSFGLMTAIMTRTRGRRKGRRRRIIL